MLIGSGARGMKVNHKKLRKLPVDREIKRKELSRMAGVGNSTLTKMSKNENVNPDMPVRICSDLNCDFHDVAEPVREDDKTNGGNE
jgi:DNA-binding Xre family transcriptional regulator